MDMAAVKRYLAKEVPKQWAARIDERITMLGYRNAMVAVLAGTTDQTISRVRAGELVPRDYLRYAIAVALRTTPERLFPMPTLDELQRAIGQTAKAA